MGIKGLTQLIGDHAPEAMKENEVKNYFGRRIAIDASMALYAFLIAVRPEASIWLANEAGETTSHLLGMWSRALRLIKYGVKPIFIFDGKPPELKGEELKRRSAKKKEAQATLEEAKEKGDTETIAKMEKRTVHVTQKHNDECKKLLRLMGIPVIEAPTEAEAQCATLAAAGLVYATGTEDMDALTFATPVLLRRLNLAEAQKKPIMEIHLDKVLTGLGLTMDQFIDLCILCGCDYVPQIKGIGPKRALEYIVKYGSIEAVLKNIDHTRYVIPENYNYEGARRLFKQPDVTPAEQVDLTWGEPDEEGLLKYLVEEKQFARERVLKGILNLRKSRTTTVQGRLEGFFTKKPAVASPIKPAGRGKRGPAPPAAKVGTGANAKTAGKAKVLPLTEADLAKLAANKTSTTTTTTTPTKTTAPTTPSKKKPVKNPFLSMGDKKATVKKEIKEEEEEGEGEADEEIGEASEPKEVSGMKTPSRKRKRKEVGSPERKIKEEDDNGDSDDYLDKKFKDNREEEEEQAGGEGEGEGEEEVKKEKKVKDMGWFFQPKRAKKEDDTTTN